MLIALAGVFIAAVLRLTWRLKRFTADVDAGELEFHSGNALCNTIKRIPVVNVASVGTRSEWEAEGRPGRSFWAYVSLRSGDVIDLSNVAEAQSLCQLKATRIAVLMNLPVRDFAAP
jgi:hypothetical protein